MKRVHELRIWPLSQERVICTCHVGVDRADLRLSNAIGDYLKANYGFYEVTGKSFELYSTRRYMPSFVHVQKILIGIVLLTIQSATSST